MPSANDGQDPHNILAGGHVSRRDILVFLLGLLSPFLVKLLSKAMIKWYLKRKNDVQPAKVSQMYNLKHGILNIDTRNTPMWMNMGYWKDQQEPRDFPQACTSLLRKILVTAGLVSGSEILVSSSFSDTKSRTLINIVDVGFGCGDQSVALQEFINLASYTGITIDSKQFAYAEQRLSKQRFISRLDKESPQDPRPLENRRIFNGDAARPDTWNTELQKALGRFDVSKDAVVQNVESWVLGMDVLYHFSPSRLPLFQHAHQNLHASIMAFDLLLPEPSQQRLTVIQSILIYVISLLTSTPYTNFLTPAQYRDQLMAAGYREDLIEIHDVSADVFAPLAAYLGWQDRQLKAYGLGIGSFHAARWLFGWWARSGVVRGCIVVARRDKKDTI